MAHLLPSLIAHARHQIQVLRGDFRRDENAFLGSPGLGIAGAILGSVVSILIIAAFIGLWFTSTATAVETFNDPNTTTGDSDADGLLPIFGKIIAFAAVFAIVGLVVAAVYIGKKVGSK